MSTVKLMLDLWPICISILGLVFAVGKLVQKVNGHDVTLKKVVDADTIVKRHLFNRETSESIYVPRAACISLQTMLRETLAKIEASSEKTGKEIVDIKISMSGIQRAIEEREKWEARNHKSEQ